MVDSQPGPKQSERSSSDPNEIVVMAFDALLRRLHRAGYPMSEIQLYGSRTIDDGFYKNDFDLFFQGLQQRLEKEQRGGDYVEEARNALIRAANTQLDDGFTFSAPSIPKEKGHAFAAEITARYTNSSIAKKTKVIVLIDSDDSAKPVLEVAKRTAPLSRHTKLDVDEKFGLGIRDPNETLAGKMAAIGESHDRMRKALGIAGNHRVATAATYKMAKHLLGVANAVLAQEFDLEKVARAYKHELGLPESFSRTELKDHKPGPTTVKVSPFVETEASRIVKTTKAKEQLDPTLTPTPVTDIKVAYEIWRNFHEMLANEPSRDPKPKPELHLPHVELPLIAKAPPAKKAGPAPNPTVTFEPTAIRPSTRSRTSK